MQAAEADMLGEVQAPVVVHAPESEPFATTNATRRKLALMAADGVALALGTALAFALQAFVRPDPGFDRPGHALLALSVIPGFAVGAAVRRLYQSRANERAAQEFRNVASAVAFGIATLVLVAFLAQYKELSRAWVILLAGSILLSVSTERAAARRVFERLRASGRSVRHIIIVGTDAHAIGLINTYERNPKLGYRVIGLVGPDPNAERGGIRVLGPIDDIDEILVRERANGVVMSLASLESAEVNQLTRRLTDDGYHVALSSMLHDIDVTRLRPQALDGRTMLYVEPVLRGGWHLAAKRAFDLALASLILVLTAPLMLVAIVAIKLEDRGPAFFRQERVGRNGRHFELIKLRSMGIDAEERKSELEELNEADGPLFKIERDPRITRTGRIIRKLSIDELPQLFCVLRGTMSMVGPRPALPAEAELWDDGTRERLRVHPGLTGLWQVSGRSDSSFEQYRRLDLMYVHNWSLIHDLKICTRTMFVVLSGRGAS